MVKLLSSLSLFALTLIFASCEKEQCEKLESTYVAYDYKETSLDFAGIPATEVGALWITIYPDADKNWDYKLVAKRGNGELSYEKGSADFDNLNVSMVSETSNGTSHSGWLNKDKSMLTLDYSYSDIIATVKFKLKAEGCDYKKDCCKKGKSEKGKDKKDWIKSGK